MSEFRTVLRHKYRAWTPGDLQDLELCELRGCTFSWSSAHPAHIVVFGAVSHLLKGLEEVEAQEFMGGRNIGLPFPDPFTEPSSTEEIDDAYSA